MVSFILPGNSATGGYEVDNSLRFNDGSSDHLTRSLGASETSTTKGTFSFWVKRGQLTTAQMIYTNEVADDNNRGQILFEDNDTFMIRDTVSGSNTTLYATSQLFRDTSAWYHMVVALDSTQAGGNRIRVYKNGTIIPDAQFGTSTEPNQNSNFNVLTGGQTNKNHIGKVHGGSNYFDGYLAEFVYCDGQVLDATSFGEFDEDTGIWKPIDVSGLTFGNNGFYLDFENASSLGADVSGNSNNFTVNNLTSIDQSIDTCTNNFATMNNLLLSVASLNFTEGNLTNNGNSSSTWRTMYSTIGASSGKWYFEVRINKTNTSDPNNFIVGIQDAEQMFQASNTAEISSTSRGYGYRGNGGNKVNNTTGSGSSYGNSFALGDILGIAVDTVNNKLYFSKNGTWQNSGDPTSGSTGTGAVSIADLGTTASTNSGNYFLSWSDESNSNGATLSWNFGQGYFGTTQVASAGTAPSEGGIFEYDCPSGYQSLCTKGLNSF